MSNFTTLPSGIKKLTVDPTGEAGIAITDNAVISNAHFVNTSNPHGVTAAQVGAAATSHSHTESDITDLGSYLANLSEDTSPQLGGNLDAQSNDITSVGNLTATGDVDCNELNVENRILGSTYGGEVQFNSDNMTIQARTDGDIIFNEGGDNETVRILANGNVGIGTSSPSSKLDIVSGNIELTTAHGIVDDSSNEQLLFTKTTSAVNYLNATNSATGVGPKIEAAGSDTNIDLLLGKKGTGAIIAGDLTGNARGTNAIDIQSARFAVTQVASGNNASAFGRNNTVSGYYGSSAFGSGNTASGNSSSAVGYFNIASGTGSSAFGYFNTAEGDNSSAIGYSNTAEGTSASAFGHGNIASGDNSIVVGYKSQATTLNSVSVGNQNFTGVATGLAAVSIGILNGAQGDTLNTGTGAITGTITSDTTVGNLATMVGIQNAASGDRTTAVGYLNTASGTYGSSAVGYENEASGTYGSSAFGYNNIATSDKSSAFGYLNNAINSTGTSAVGYLNTASGTYSSAFGYGNLASGIGASSAFGYGNLASGTYSSAFGSRCKTTIANTAEIGYWSSTTVRAGAVRMHPNGQVAMTIEDSATAPTDGGATAGSEADGTLPRSMVAFRRNSGDLLVDKNVSGTITTVNLALVPIAAGSVASTGTAGRIKGATVAKTSMGLYTITFDTAQADANYIVTATIKDDGGRTHKIYFVNKTTTTFQIETAADDNSSQADILTDFGFDFVVHNWV